MCDQRAYVILFPLTAQVGEKDQQPLILKAPENGAAAEQFLINSSFAIQLTKCFHKIPQQDRFDGIKVRFFRKLRKWVGQKVTAERAERTQGVNRLRHTKTEKMLPFLNKGNQN